jgi:hypothetical protein
MGIFNSTKFMEVDLEMKNEYCVFIITRRCLNSLPFSAPASASKRSSTSALEQSSASALAQSPASHAAPAPVNGGKPGSRPSKKKYLRGTFLPNFIVTHKYIDGELHFLVRWEGFGPESDTYETIHCVLGEEAQKMFLDYMLKFSL